MQIELLAKNIVRELVESGALEQAVKKATGTTPTPPTASTGNFIPAKPEKNSLAYSLRGDCLSLVDKVCEKWGLEKVAVYSELKKRTGVGQPEASPEKLSERIDLLQCWLEDGRL